MPRWRPVKKPLPTSSPKDSLSYQVASTVQILKILERGNPVSGDGQVIVLVDTISGAETYRVNWQLTGDFAKG